MKRILRTTIFIFASLAFGTFGGEKTVIACVGNSITESSPYTSILQNLLGNDYTVHNEGHSGRTMLKKAVVTQWEASYWDSDKFDHVFSVNPDIITIMLGTNDSKPENWDPYGDEFYDDYNAMIDTFLTITPTPKIILVRPPPSFSGNQYRIDSLNIINEIVPIIDSISIERAFYVIDCYTPLSNYPQYFSDKVHPTRDGAEAIAEILFEGLNDAVSTKKYRQTADNRPFWMIRTEASGSYTSVYNIQGRRISPALHVRNNTSMVQPRVIRKEESGTRLTDGSVE